MRQSRRNHQNLVFASVAQFRSDYARSLSEVPRRMRFRHDEDLWRGTFDKVVRSEPLARAPLRATRTEARSGWSFAVP